MTSESKIIIDTPLNLASKARLTLFPNACPSDTFSLSPETQYDVAEFHDVEARAIILDLSAQQNHLISSTVIFWRADIVLLIIDAASELVQRDIRRKMLAGFACIPHLVLAIDNMETVGWSKERFELLKADFTKNVPEFTCNNLSVIPVDFQNGDNIHSLSGEPTWYDGPPLIDLLSKLEPKNQLTEIDADTETSDQFAVHICWVSSKPMLPGRHYLLEAADGAKVGVNISALKYRLSTDALKHQAATGLEQGDIGYGNLSLDRPVTYANFNDDPRLGSFELFDPETGKLIAICMIKHALRRATNIHWQELEIDKSVRAKYMKQSPCVLWFTGFSGSGKSTIASLLEKKLHTQGQFTYILDGDNVRHGLCRDLGFTDADRVENLRRISETAKLFVDAGLIVLASFISPFRSERKMAREQFCEGEFIEIFVDTPFKICEHRDTKGLYKMARAGKLKNFTGIDSAYEAPKFPEIHLDGANGSVEELVERVMAELEKLGLVHNASTNSTKS